MNAQGQRITDSQRRSFIGGSDALIITGDDEGTIPRLWQEKRGEAEPEDLSGVLRPHQPCYRACAKPSPGPVCTAHSEFVAALDGHPPRPIPLDADAVDLEDRADHLSKVFGTLSVYLAVILDDTAQNVPGRLDLPDVEAHLADLAADVAGLIERAAEDMRGWIA
jgi:uncharacterized protein with PhoU and TrkA domain